MRKYKMIALAYNEASTSVDAFDKVFDSANGFCRKGISSYGAEEQNCLMI